MTSVRNAWETASVVAENYDRQLVPLLFQPWVDDLVRRVSPQAGERVLDVACGTGVVAQTVAPLVSESGTVVGLDVNPDMLAVARRMTSGAGPTITWVRATAAETELPDSAFDVVLCQQGLQFFPDRLAALRELHRVLAPGGRIALSVWCDSTAPGYPPFIPAFERHLTDPSAAVGFVRAIFALHDDRELERLLTAAGFGDVRIVRSTRVVRCASPAAWAEAFLRAAPIGTIDEPALSLIVADVTRALRPLAGEDGFAFPISAHVATATRLLPSPLRE